MQDQKGNSNVKNISYEDKNEKKAANEVTLIIIYQYC